MQNSLEQAMLQVALDLNLNLPSGHHYQRLMQSLQSVLPCDASALFILDESGLLSAGAVNGLSEEVLGQKFDPKQHPRLQAIMDSRQPVRFPASSTLPDPFDGLLKDDPNRAIDIHDCMGCSLYVEDNLVGLITIDALQVGAFKRVDDITVETFAALAAATIRNVNQVEALRKSHRQQQSMNQVLIQEAREKSGELIGISAEMQSLRNNIHTVAHSDYAVLISGETGTGKDLVAHALHANSSRAKQPMIYVNCAALPESLAESELFGHVKGAFTGATCNRAGKFELADGGTIFLDEIGELPLLLQAKLLRVIQQGEVQRVGADQNIFINVRIIAATNRDLPQEVEAGQFRRDLYHRLNVFPIKVPALRQRQEDIAVLSGHILDRVRLQFNVAKLQLHPQAITALKHYDWPGNVRELEHTLMRAGLRAIQDQQHLIGKQHLSDEVSHKTDAAEQGDNSALPNTSFELRGAVERYQTKLISHALQQSNFVWAQAAEFLQMDRGNLYKMGKKLGIKPSKLRGELT
jgi:anaerobic nitric oxide reductase transcription regulator